VLDSYFLVIEGSLRMTLRCRNRQEINVCHEFYFINFVVCFLLGNSQATEFYMPTFRNTRSVPSSEVVRYEV